MHIGQPGQMIPLKCPTTLRVTVADRYSFATTMGGAVKAQAGPAGRRTWDVQLGQLSTPSDVGTLMEFARGAWGVGPFHFIPTDAPVVNLLTPDASLCHPDVVHVSEEGGLLGSPPMILADQGVAARSVWKTGDGDATIGPPVAVIPDQPITATVWAVGVGEGRVRLIFRNASGVTITTTQSAPATAVASQLRVTTRTPPTAATVQLVVTEGITQAARPVITLTDQPYEWGEGQGCIKAVVHDTSRDVTKAWDNPRTGRWSDVAFTVQEVG